MSSGKTFLLGVGAQKAGTTWLHSYLAGHPNADLGFAKEYHVFDVLHVEHCRIFHDWRRREISSPKSWFTRQGWQIRRLIRFQERPETYFRYFAQRAAREGVLLTGDITPAYAALPAPVFREIRAGILRAGLRPRVVFILRDPVERCISGTRMHLREEGGGHTAEDETRTLMQRFATTPYEARTRYDLTIRALEAAFAPEELRVVFYEELFTRAVIGELCTFLGLPFREPDFAEMHNVSRTEHEIGVEARRAVFDHYAEVYAFVRERFGARVDALWRPRP